MKNADYVVHAGLRRRHWHLIKDLLWLSEQDCRTIARYTDLTFDQKQEFERRVKETREARLSICSQLKGRP